MVILAMGLGTLMGCSGSGTHIGFKDQENPGTSSTLVPCDEYAGPGEPCPGDEWARRVAENRHFADELPFQGDQASAEAEATRVRAALDELITTTPSPDADQLRAALAPWAVGGAGVQVSESAVRTAGVAFAIEIAGGCVKGSVSAGTVEVRVAGYINDGGCLAVNPH